MAEYKDITPIKEQIAHVKRNVKSENSAYLIGYISALSTVEGMIASLPAADVEVVKRGEWKYIKSGEGVFDYYFECSECHASTPDKAYPTNPDFCPYCGSKNVSLDCGICCVNYKDGKEVQE